MRIVIIGGTGFIGSKLVAALRRQGHNVLAASLESGVDTFTGQGLNAALRAAQVVADVTNAPSFDDAAVMSFFQTSGRNLVAAETAAGVQHHLLLSVVGADRLPDSGYLRAKIAQEDLIKTSGIPYTIARSTQFLEFMPRVADLFSDGTVLRVPPALLQPIVSDDVVAALADLVLQAAPNATLELAGPEKIRFDYLIRRVLDHEKDSRQVLTDPHARYFGALLSAQSLMPASASARIGATSLETWFSRSK